MTHNRPNSTSPLHHHRKLYHSNVFSPQKEKKKNQNIKVLGENTGNYITLSGRAWYDIKVLPQRKEKRLTI